MQATLPGQRSAANVIKLTMPLNYHVGTMASSALSSRGAPLPRAGFHGRTARNDLRVLARRAADAPMRRDGVEARPQRNDRDGGPGFEELLMIGEISRTEDAFLRRAAVNGIGEANLGRQIDPHIRTHLHDDGLRQKAVVDGEIEAGKRDEAGRCRDRLQGSSTSRLRDWDRLRRTC
jgi:hypothetical protein